MPYYTAKDDSVTISDWLGLPGIRHSGGLARWWHFACALFWILNGQPLNIYHGAPLRLRCENELGFKQVKWIEAIEFVEDYKKLGAERGGYNEDHEFYSWRDPI